MTETEKLRALTSLATTLFQHTELEILPSCFCCMEDDGYNAEYYCLGWQNDCNLSEIRLEEDDNNKYIFCLSVIEYEKKDGKLEMKKDFTRWECYPIEEFLKYPTNPILEDFAKYINIVFGE